MRELVERDIADELPNGYPSKNIATAVMLAVVLHVAFLGVFSLIGSHAAADDKGKTADKGGKPVEAAKVDADKAAKPPGADPARSDRPAAAAPKDGEKPAPVQIETARPSDIPDRPEEIK